MAPVATPAERIEAAILAAEGAALSRVAGARPIAIGWATVELDRAAAELAVAFGVGADAFEPVPRSPALGCACRVATGILAEGLSLALVEPDTEGRLAASLARLGEGPRVAWLQAEEPATAADALRAAGFAASAERDGPFGPECLVVDGADHGPSWLLLGASAGTIRP